MQQAKGNLLQKISDSGGAAAASSPLGASGVHVRFALDSRGDLHDQVFVQLSLRCHDHEFAFALLEKFKVVLPVCGLCRDIDGRPAITR